MNHHNSGITRYLLCVSLLTLYCVIMAFAGSVRTDTAFKYDEGFLTWEEGNPTYRSMRLLEGKTLYQDLACPYGPLPVYLRAALAWLLGNSVYMYVGWHLIWSIAAILLIFTILWRSMPWYAALAGTVFVTVPRLLTTGGFTEYIGIERIFLLLPLLLWKPLPGRSLSRSAVLALCCGMLQTVKFGSMIFLGMGLLGIDIASMLTCKKKDVFCLKSLIRHLLIMGFFMLLPQAIFTAWAFLSCNKDIAIDALWPAYMKRSYRVISPAWGGWKYFLIAQLPILGNLFIGLIALIQSRSKKDARTRALKAAAIGIIFYCMAAPVYFGHDLIYYQYAFMLIPAAILGSFTKPLLLMPLLVMFNITPFLVQQKVAWIDPRDSTLVEMRMPNGERLLGRTTFRDDLKYLEEHVIPAITPQENLLFDTGLAGGGFHAVYNPHYPLREFIGYGTFRSYDRRELERKAANIGWLLVSSNSEDLSDANLARIKKKMSNIMGPKLWSSFRERIPADGIVRLNHFIVIRFKVRE